MVVEAEPDVAAAMDILSFALYHENNQVIGENDARTSSQKRQREEPDLTDTSDPDDDENDPKRQREEGTSQEQGDKGLADLKRTIFEELSRSLEDSIAIDDIASTVDVDRDLVLQAIQQLEAENKVMHADGEVFLID